MIACEASTPITEEDAVRPVPANNVAKALIAVFCSFAPSESSVDKKSPLAGVTVLNSDKSKVSVTSPDEPPPDRPTPAFTAVMSPPSGCSTQVLQPSWPPEKSASVRLAQFSVIVVLPAAPTVACVKVNTPSVLLTVILPL